MSIEKEELIADEFWHTKTNRRNSRNNWLYYDKQNTLIKRKHNHLYRLNNDAGNVFEGCKKIITKERQTVKRRNEMRRTKTEF